MSPEIAEKAFERAIEQGLLKNGPDDPDPSTSLIGEKDLEFSEFVPGGYRKRLQNDYDRALCLIPRDVVDFIYATQPEEWQKLKDYYGPDVKERFFKRLSSEISKRGALDVFRKGLKDAGCRFKLAYFRPASGLNEEIQKLYEGNLFSVVRQLHYSERNDKSLDMALFLNGIPLFTAEFKNPFTGQNVEHAINQYRYDRDPHEALLAFRRCIAHFAVDPDLIYVTTHLQGPKTRFLPFNQGKFGGAGNPPKSPTETGYATDYLWNRVWSRDSVLNLIQYFIHEIEVEDDKGRKTGERLLLFPRYHQLDSVRRLIDHAKAFGAGQQYLIQHSAGSGKSNSIAWLAHQLSVLHDKDDQRLFDSIVVITDRRVLDRQLQRTVRQFEQTSGVVENIDTTSRKLKEALESGKTIIVTTLQKFPVIVEDITELAGKRFAVIVDEAHSSQSGESTKSLKTVLAAGSLEEAEQEEAGAETPEEELDNRILEEMEKRGRLANVSWFAFTATPKPKTFELFGSKRDDGSFQAFSLYTMRQAIEENFILDVLENYTNYKVYWKLLKTAQDDPHYEKGKASYLLRSFVDLHEHAIQKKIEIMIEHFHGQIAHQIRGKAKAMIVARSRLHAVRYKLAFDAYIKERGYPYQSLVAFSGTVRDEGIDYTEANMNGYSEKQTADVFKRPEYRFLIVANKFQTGFDQELLHTMYVDKKLGGVNAVQTLSRLNRIHPEKEETVVLDFVNDAQAIQESFQPYYEKTILSEATDPNTIYDLERRLEVHHVFDTNDVDSFARRYFHPKATQDELYALLAPCVERYKALEKEERFDFRGTLTDYIRLYAFLSQIITFTDPDLEKLYVFSRLLRRYLPRERDELPREIQQKIDMESYRITQRWKGRILLERGNGTVEPIGVKKDHIITFDQVEALSQIVRELNERFGTEFSDEDKVFIQTLEERLADDPALVASVRVNTPENARLTFDHVVVDRLQDMVDTNFKLYKRITDDQGFAKYFVDRLFERFWKSIKGEKNR